MIVSYRSRQPLARCLESIAEHGRVDGAPPEVWVVDNASDDGTAAMVSERFPEVRLVANRANLGFSAANNLALREVRTEYVLVLNPDTVLHAETLPHLVGLLDRRPEIGMVGCRLVRPDGSFDHAARRAFPTIAGALGHFTGLGRGTRSNPALAQYRAPHLQGSGRVDAINGAFMLARTEALREVGLFDEGYWLYMEDLDLCYRLHQAGFEVWYAAEVSATHLKGASSGRHRRLRQNRAFHYGMFRFYRKFYAPTNPRPLNALVYAGIAAKFLVSASRSGAARALRGGWLKRRRCAGRRPRG